MLDAIVIEPKKTATHCVIWLHGLGADGHNFKNIVPALNLPEIHSIRFVFPHALMRPITVNGQMEMRAWYDIFTLTSLKREDEEGMYKSCELIEDLIKKQALNKKHIVLAGFSQGGVIALLMGAHSDEAYAGILSLSAYLPFMQTPGKRLIFKNKEQTILQCHGIDDDIIPIQTGKESYEYLKEVCKAAKWKAYPMAHHVCPQEIQDIGRWLREVMGI